MKWIFFAAMMLSLSIAAAQVGTTTRGLHVLITDNASLSKVKAELPALAKAGINTVFVETDYSFQFLRSPKMSTPTGVSTDAARKFSKAAKAVGIRPIPQINCLGHQSWAETTATLLAKYPEFDETPGQFPGNKDIYCRSWCPQHPDLLKVVLPLIDELVEAFDADAFHVGMDEVFLMAHDSCPRCKGGNPAKLFAKAVNDLHQHIVKKRKLQMYMWADRLLDGKATGYGEWEAATNGTHGAIDLIPKDIVMCDWHYEPRTDYPSLKILGDKGFPILVSGFKDLRAIDNFSLAAKTSKSPGVVGYIATTWGEAPLGSLSTWAPLVAGMKWWLPK